MYKIVQITFNTIPAENDFIHILGLSKTFGYTINNLSVFKNSRNQSGQVTLSNNIFLLIANYVEAFQIDYPNFITKVIENKIQIAITDSCDFEYFENFVVSSNFASIQLFEGFVDNTIHVINFSPKKYISDFIANLLFLKTENEFFIKTENGKKIRHR